MARDHRGVALREIGTLFRSGTLANASDGALLDHFLCGRPDLAEAAFTVLVLRHGPMVHRVCLGVVRINQDAEDAAQATFLALLKSASRVQKRDSIASWLHGTALRVATCVRKSRERNERHESRASGLRIWPGASSAFPDDIVATIHQEINKLPETYRTALVLCDLEGFSYEEAAARVDRPVGTIKSRVSRAREQLRAKLIRRGLGPVVGVSAVLAEGEAGASMLLNWASAVYRLATVTGVPGEICRVISLSGLYRRSLLMGYLKTGVASLAVVGVLAAGATLWAQQGGGGGERAPLGLASARVDPRNPLVTKTYAVADLLFDTTRQTEALQGEKRAAVDMKPLVELLTSTVAPKTWRASAEPDLQGKPSPGVKATVSANALATMISEDDAVAGRVGTIVPFYLSVSLIIRHTPEVHEQVAQRLDQIRRIVHVRDGEKAVAEAAESNGAVGQMLQMMRGQGAMAEAGSASGGPTNATDGSGSAGPGRGSMTMSGGSMTVTGRGSMTVPHDTKPGGFSGATNADGETQRRLRALEEKLDRLIISLEKNEKPQTVQPGTRR